MTTGVKVRKRGSRQVQAFPAWAESLLEECAREMGDGAIATLHRNGCPARHSSRCDCAAILVGPAIRDPQ